MPVDREDGERGNAHRRRGCGLHRRVPRRCRPLPGPTAPEELAASVWWQARCRYDLAWTDDLLVALVDAAPASAGLVAGGDAAGVTLCFAVRAFDRRSATEQATVFADRSIRAAHAETGHGDQTPLTMIESVIPYDEQIWS